VEYFREVRNPIGVKVGPGMAPEALVGLVQRLWPNPQANPGRLSVRPRAPYLVRWLLIGCPSPPSALVGVCLWDCVLWHGMVDGDSGGRGVGDVHPWCTVSVVTVSMVAVSVAVVPVFLGMVGTCM
jgi:hypothetical protein